MEDPAVLCKDIRKSYGQNDMRIEALKGIDLEIESNKLTMLVGPSGSGKTTLLSIISTILTPDEGKLFLLGHDVSSMNDNQRSAFCRQNLGIVFQSLFLIPTLTVLENVSLPLLVGGFKENEANDKASEILAKVNMEHRSSVSPSQLSKGQQQRVAVARAMVNDSKIIMCDEPTSALDQASGLNIMHLLQDLALHSGRAILVVTHDHRIFPFANRIIHISDGQITGEGPDE